MITTTEIIFRLLLGALMGGVIGFEREVHGRPAGFRTFLLVCLSAVLIMIISGYYYMVSSVGGEIVRLDPGRIAAGAMTGIGFLGAGVIIKTKGTIYGLTTAACIWIVFAIGLAVGNGFYLPASVAFLLTYLSLWMLRRIEKKIPKIIYRAVSITGDVSLREDALRSVIQRFGSLTSIDYENDLGRGEATFTVSVAASRKCSFGDLMDELAALPGAKRIKIGTTL